MTEDNEQFISAHERTHELMRLLCQFPPLTHKKVRRRYRDLIKEWRHDTAKHKYGKMIDEALGYMELSEGDSQNAHLFYFQRNKNANPDDFIY
jgi:hypothetical protein